MMTLADFSKTQQSVAELPAHAHNNRSCCEGEGEVPGTVASSYTVHVVYLHDIPS